MYLSDQIAKAEVKASERTKRLHEIADFVMTIPPHQFDISCWWSDQLNCGCAVGHMVKRHAFGVDQGDYLDSSRNAFENVALRLGISLDDAHRVFGGAAYGAMLHHVTREMVAERARAIA